NNVTILCPSLMIHFLRNAMSRRSCCKYVHDKTFIKTSNREIHLPSAIRTPMPKQHRLVIAVPIPLHLFPKLINTGSYFSFFSGTIHIELMNSQQSLHQESGFHQVATIILETERLYFTCFSIQPMRINAMKTIGLFQ